MRRLKKKIHELSAAVIFFCCFVLIQFYLSSFIIQVFFSFSLLILRGKNAQNDLFTLALNFNHSERNKNLLPGKSHESMKIHSTLVKVHIKSQLNFFMSFWESGNVHLIKRSQWKLL